MTVHLLKMAVGIDSVAHLARVQGQRLDRARAEDGEARLRHYTRHAPRRSAELVGGGSIFWIIRGLVRVRQRIIGVERMVRREARKHCALVLDPELVRTELLAHKPIQGWRYLDPAAAPADLTAAPPADTSLPPEMAAELRALGLL